MTRIHINWFDQTKTALIITYPPQWTWQEQAEVASTLTTYLDSVTYPIHVIFDVREMITVPGDVFGHFSSLRQAPVFTHPGVGDIYVVGAQGIVLTTLNVFQRLFKTEGQRLHFVNDVHEVPSTSIA